MSSLDSGDLGSGIEACAGLCEAVYPGLRLDREILATRDQRLGETLVFEGDRGVDALAVCHLGAGTEAGEGTCYVKFAAVRPGPRAAAMFEQMILGVEGLAYEFGLSFMSAGVSTARHDAYRLMLGLGFRTQTLGIRMHRPNVDAYSREHDFVIDDWR